MDTVVIDSIPTFTADRIIRPAAITGDVNRTVYLTSLAACCDLGVLIQKDTDIVVRSTDPATIAGKRDRTAASTITPAAVQSGVIRVNPIVFIIRPTTISGDFDCTATGRDPGTVIKFDTRVVIITIDTTITNQSYGATGSNIVFAGIKGGVVRVNSVRVVSSTTSAGDVKRPPPSDD